MGRHTHRSGQETGRWQSCLQGLTQTRSQKVCRECSQGAQVGLGLALTRSLPVSQGPAGGRGPQLCSPKWRLWKEVDRARPVTYLLRQDPLDRRQEGRHGAGGCQTVRGRRELHAEGAKFEDERLLALEQVGWWPPTRVAAAAPGLCELLPSPGALM